MHPTHPEIPLPARRRSPRRSFSEGGGDGAANAVRAIEPGDIVRFGPTKRRRGRVVRLFLAHSPYFDEPQPTAEIRRLGARGGIEFVRTRNLAPDARAGGGAA